MAGGAADAHRGAPGANAASDEDAPSIGVSIGGESGAEVGVAKDTDVLPAAGEPTGDGGHDDFSLGAVSEVAPHVHSGAAGANEDTECGAEEDAGSRLAGALQEGVDVSEEVGMRGHVGMCVCGGGCVCGRVGVCM